eukprot:252890-Pyramimonas_sp.AAC.2
MIGRWRGWATALAANGNGVAGGTHQEAGPPVAPAEARAAVVTECEAARWSAPSVDTAMPGAEESNSEQVSEPIRPGSPNRFRPAQALYLP